MSTFKQNSDRSKNLIQLMSDHEERDCIAIDAEMKKRFGMGIAHATVYYYFDVLVSEKKMTINRKKPVSGRGRPRTYFKMVS